MAAEYESSSDISFASASKKNHYKIGGLPMRVFATHIRKAIIKIPHTGDTNSLDRCHFLGGGGWGAPWRFVSGGWRGWWLTYERPRID